MMQQIAPMTRNILIVNLLVFVGQQLVPSLTSLLGLRFFTADLFEPYQLLTHMFAHAGLWHLFGNMFSLFIFGSALEETWGAKRFLIFYLITGFGASLLFQAVNGWEIEQLRQELTPYLSDPKAAAYLYQRENLPVLGASGAVFGILMAFAMLYPNVRLMLLFPPIPIKAKYFVALYGAYELYATIQANPGDNVAHLAHLGGMLFAFILVKLWQHNSRSYY
ncbi:MAG: rhomboid family intramembrane serine protease [Bernardetiaceae bacterium]